MPRHEPVLLEEALELLAVSAGGFYVDGTVGLGGHSEELLRRSAPDGRLLAVDRDSETLALAKERLRESGERVRFVHAEYRDIPRLLGDERADGILLDLGLSSAQLDDPDRGFSFQADGPLDMRMDRSHGETAADVVNRLGEPELADVIYRFGEERASRRIARAIATARRQSRIRTTAELAEIVRRAAPHGRPGLHPATRTFQAIRIRVNRELEGLGATVAALARALKPGGRLAVIAFHSLEDREVKQAFRDLEPEGFHRLTKKP
ncbi:MAG TPA: 16S rRNA (cytosine(1402)-N(4))-methyltransferase RsmH, partial [Vicinamibacteria bacterium]